MRHSLSLGIAGAALAASLLAGLSAHADEAKFTNLMGSVPTSGQIVEGLIMPLGIRLERARPDAEAAVAAGETAPVVAATPDVASAKPPATIALEVRFDFNSATLTPEARDVLVQLAAALKAPALAENSFLIEGHTDATGADGYNQDLSERRADAVMSFLTREHGVDADRLVAVGRGESELLDPQHASSGVNRRVEVGNLGAQQDARLDVR